MVAGPSSRGSPVTEKKIPGTLGPQTLGILSGTFVQSILQLSGPQAGADHTAVTAVPRQ